MANDASLSLDCFLANALVSICACSFAFNFFFKRRSSRFNLGKFRSCDVLCALSHALALVQLTGDSPGPLPFKNQLSHLRDARIPAHISDHQALLICTSSVAFKQMFHMSRVSLFMLFSLEEFAFLRQVSKGSEEAFLLAIRPVVLNLKGWVVIYTMYVNFMRLRLPNVLFFRQV